MFNDAIFNLFYRWEQSKISHFHDFYSTLYWGTYSHKTKKAETTKEDTKLFFIMDNKISYVEKSYKIFKTNTDLKVKFSYVAGHKVNIKKWIRFLYASSKQLGREILKTPFTIATQNRISHKLNKRCAILLPYRLKKNFWEYFKTKNKQIILWLEI